METLMFTILVPALVVGAIGLVFGTILAFSAQAFAVKVDERIALVREVLPGVNCGACGQTGCDLFAQAVVEGSAKPTGCPVGGESVAAKVAQILGIEVTNTLSYTARVFCQGTTECAPDKYRYEGIASCAAAAALHNGPKACPFGCVGFGDCAAACPFDAIVVENGLARVDERLCRSCENCVAVCPKKLISMVPRGKDYSVLCKNTQRGPIVKKNCDVGCIACTKCEKVCPAHAISISNNLAKIDPQLCQNCGDCVAVCPTHAIVSSRSSTKELAAT